jgi:hypothetical protein
MNMKVVFSSEICEFYLTGPHHNQEGSNIFLITAVRNSELKLFALFGRVTHESHKNLILALPN